MRSSRSHAGHNRTFVAVYLFLILSASTLALHEAQAADLPPSERLPICTAWYMWYDGHWSYGFPRTPCIINGTSLVALVGAYPYARVYYYPEDQQRPLEKYDVCDDGTRFKSKLGTTPCSHMRIATYDAFVSSPLNSLDRAKNNGAYCPKGGVSPFVGNPINLATGNKYQREVDLEGVGPFPLRFVRHYNSQGRGSDFSKGWRHTYDRRVLHVPGGDSAIVIRANGRELTFTLVNGIWTAPADVSESLERVENGWVYRTSADAVETYDEAGRLLAVQTLNGLRHVLSYDASGRLVGVTDSLGNSLELTYLSTGKIGSIRTGDGREWDYGYAANGMLESVQNPDGTFRRYHYEQQRVPYLLTGITDERGVRYATFSYDRAGWATSSRHAENAQRVDVTYHADGSRLVRDSRGHSSTYRLGAGHGTALVDSIDGPGCSACGSGESSYTYDAANNVTSKTEHGITTEYGNYDTQGNPGYRIEAAGTPQARRIEFTYDSRFHGKVTARSEPSVYAGGRKVTTYTYDDFGNPTEVTTSGYQPDGTPVARTTRYAYDGPLNQLTRIDGPRSDVNDVTTFEYYPNEPSQGPNRGRLARVIDPSGLVLRDQIQYSQTGKVRSERRPNGLALSYSYYPGNDRLATFTESAGNATRVVHWTYLPTGEVESVTRGYGTAAASTLTLHYDGARRLTSLADGLGNVIRYTLDAEGNRTAEEVYDSAGRLRRAVARTFDVYNRLDTSAQANERVDYDFAPDGSLTGETGGRGTASHYDYDALHRLVTTTRDFGGSDPATANTTVTYGYGAGERVTRVTDPNGNATTYVYDDLGDLLSETSPDAGTTTYAYDAAGNVRSRTDAERQTTTYRYDADNRILAAAYADGTAAVYDYDKAPGGAGRLAAVEDASGGTEWEYTPFGEVRLKRQSVGSLNFVITYEYDVAGDLVRITYPSGRVVEYAYEEGQVRSVAVDGAPLATDIRHAPFGPISEWTWRSGPGNERLYDMAGRVSAYTVAGDTRRLTYDAVGDITALSDSRVNRTFGYDALSRLTAANDASFDQAFAYDANGNRLELREATGMTSYSYAPDSNRLLQMVADTTREYRYDANGNTVDDGRHTYTYDARNRLVAVDDGRTANYRLNALGQRVYKQVPVPGDANGDGVIDQNDLRALAGKQGTALSAGADCNGDGVVDNLDVPCTAQKMAATKSGKAGPSASATAPQIEPELYFVDDEQGHLIGEYDRNGNAVREMIWLENLPVGLLTNGALYNIHPDHLGTPRAITDQAGTVVWRWDSDPFGTTAANEDPDGDGQRLVFNLRFPGQYLDEETGQHYNYFRDFDPKAGRYLEFDPVGLKGGLNAYAYVRNNPLTLRDPAGLYGSGSDFIAGFGFDPGALPRSPEEAAAMEHAPLPEQANIVGQYGEAWAALTSAMLAPDIGALKGLACRAGTEILSRPATITQMATDFATSLFPGSPAMSAAGTAGFFAGSATNPQEALR